MEKFHKQNLRRANCNQSLKTNSNQPLKTNHNQLKTNRNQPLKTNLSNGKSLPIKLKEDQIVIKKGEINFLFNVIYTFEDKS